MQRGPRSAVMLVVGLVCWAGSTQAWSQATDSALKDRVAQLVERLSAPKAEAQAAAEKALVDLGERALPFLPSGGPSAGKLDKIRQTIREKAEASTVLGASTVTLQARGIRLTEAIKAIQGQTGNTINDLREANGEEATNPAFDIDINTRPFFEALDIVADKAGLKITPYTGDGTIGLMTGGMEPSPGMPTRAKPPVVYSGPFRIEFKQFAIVRDFGLTAGTASAQFEVMWEPRLRPMLLGVKNEDLVISDEQGRSIAPQVKDQADETALRAGNCAAELNLALASPERSATKLASLKVKGLVTVPSGMRLFRFPSLAATNVVQKQGDISVTLESTEVDEQVWKVALVVAYPEGGGPAFASYRQGLFNNRLWLQKPDGSRFEQNGGYNNTGADDARIGFEYLFVDAPGKPGDHSLVYETPSKVVPIPLEFEFKDILLP